MSTKVRSLATFAALALVCTALARADPHAVRSRSRRAQPTDEEKQEFMDGVNGARADRNASDMNELVWNDELAEFAFEWTDSCRMEEPSWAAPPTEYTNFGSTVAVQGGPDHDEFASIVQTSWIATGSQYDFDTNTCNSGGACDSFLQLTTNNLVAFGCSSNICAALEGFPAPNAKIFVCLYSATFDTSQPPYTVGDACTECPSGTYRCRDGLCAHSLVDCTTGGSNCTCGLECQNCGTVDEAVCDGCQQCATGFIGAECELECGNFNDSCGEDGVLPASWCSDSDHPEVAESCPLMCGECEMRNSTSPVVCEFEAVYLSPDDDLGAIKVSSNFSYYNDEVDDVGMLPAETMTMPRTTITKPQTTFAPAAPPRPPIILSTTASKSEATTAIEEIGNLEVSSSKPKRKSASGIKPAASFATLILSLVSCLALFS